MCYLSRNYVTSVDSMVERLERLDCVWHGLGSKPTRTILLYAWEKHLPLLDRHGKQF